MTISLIRVHKTGGPDVLQYEKGEAGAPKPGEVLIRHTAIGLNFIDTYHRTGLYSLPLPFTPGLEAAGVVEVCGEGVTDLRPGQRVAYGAGPVGAYAEKRIMPADRLTPLPDGVSDEAAAAMMLKGMTAEYLLHRTFKVKKGDTILFHAISGGVGQIACQWAKHIGATVIGTASAGKADTAKALGCDHVIRYDEEDFVARVKEITDGKGVPVVYDSVGRTTFRGSLECLAPQGMLVSFGQSSGSVPPFDITLLSQRGGAFLARPSVGHYTATKEELRSVAGHLLSVVADGHVKIDIHQRYALKDAAQAHTDLEARNTKGSTILLP